jgi:DNA-binding response OmpR family regulator
VLVVDDNKAMRVFLSHLLRDRFRVETAESLQAARRELHRHRPDAILLDLELGDGDGYTLLDDLQAAGSPAPDPHEASLPGDASQEVDGGSRGAGGCRRIDARLADVSVLVVSGRSDSADRTKALALGAADYVAKPFHPPELLQRLSIRVDT